MTSSFGRLTLPDDPDDPIILDIRSSALEFAVCTRAAVGRLTDLWEGTGTYLLLGFADEQGRVRAYVGKTARLRTRLREHVTAKPWWNRSVLLQSKSRDGFTTADAAWMEAEIVRRLLSWESITLENGNRPSELSLSSHEVEWLDGVVDDLFRILRLLGHNELVDIATATTLDPSTDTTPDVWVVRGGEGGAIVDQFRERSEIRISFSDTFGTDLTRVSLDELRATGGKASSIGQLLRFRDLMKVGDYVLTPARGSTSYLVGRVSGHYRYDTAIPGFPHVRDVTWLTDLPADQVADDLRRSLGSILTLFRPRLQEDLLALLAISAAV